MTDKVDKAIRTIAGELRRTEDALDDARHHLDKWGFSMAPSEGVNASTSSSSNSSSASAPPRSFADEDDA